jgi:hypothetical protein
MVEKKTYRMLLEEAKGKIALGKPKCSWENMLK